VKAIVSDNEHLWTDVEYNFGSKGPIRGKQILLRVMDIRDGKANQWVWLYASSQAGEKLGMP
jgi:hypothetical protein